MLAATSPSMASALPLPLVALVGGGLLGLAMGLLVGWLWSRRREAGARREILDRARSMLRERLSDHLHLLLTSATAPDRPLDAGERVRLTRVVVAAREVESALDLLSEASIRAWERSRGATADEEDREGRAPAGGA